MSPPVRILHVEDDPEFADLTATVLERDHPQFTIEHAPRADQALDLLAADPPDCIVSDYDMPGMDGIEFLKTVREDHPDLPFILFTGKGSEEIASDAISAGVTDYLQKQSGTDQYALLANKIDHAVNRARANQRRRQQQQAIETAREGIAILDADGYFTYVNTAYADIYHCDPEDLIGTHWETCYPEEELGYVRDHILPRVNDAGVWHGQTTHLRADGSSFTADHAVSRTDSGNLVCTIRETSPPGTPEQQLDRYRTLVELLNDPVYVLDETGTVVYVNNAFTDLTGYERDTLLGSEPSLIKDDTAIETAETHLARLLSSDGPDSTRFEIDIQPADGDPIRCEDHMTTLPDEGGAFSGSAGVLREITQPVERERELTFFEALFTTMGTAIAVYDQTGTFEYVNEACARLLDTEPSILEDLAVWDINPEFDRARFDDYWASFEDRETRTAETTLAFEGERVQVETITTRREIQTTTYHFGTIVDITERKRRERQLQRQLDQFEHFGAVLSHDLRTPLQTIAGRIELARQTEELSHLDQAAAALERVEVLVEDLATVMREGDFANEMTVVALETLIEDVWEGLPTGDINLEVGEIGSIRADRSAVTRMIENLLRNALEHGGETVRVGGFGDGFYLEDTGPGIPEDRREEIFEVGYSTKRSDEGTGFGLASAKQIAIAHGWDITVTEGEEGGARFEITDVEFAAE